MRQFNFFNPQEAALLRERPKFRWNPLPWVWTAWQWFAYFFVPPGAEPCQYCWALRMFVLGLFIGGELMYFFPWLKVW